MVRELEVAGFEGDGAEHGGLRCGVGDLVGGEGGEDGGEGFGGCFAFEGVCCAGAGVGLGGDGEEGGGGEGGTALLEVGGWKGEGCGDECQRQRCGDGGGVHVY